MTNTELLFEAIQTNDCITLENLLKKNPALVNVKDSRGFTPLIFATYFDNEQATKIILDYGAEIDAKDATGNTALIGVCFKGNIRFANMLLKHGAHINAQNNLGTTPLIFASMYNKEKMVGFLLQNGADKAKVDNEGKTAYDRAKEKGYITLLELLK
ncbi:ankyrin repeat domain-containing protein [uncultured Psychroserpens sp.]|uniref:ankyrin repeat domain-containing protein n=1 Tax=uncultured Psychroserpens sp. TaxID=255436 RepID=UPI00261C062E|nr:ankyrin repeat domain-containing protein [uncultured Psychroserpens sp.]